MSTYLRVQPAICLLDRDMLRIHCLFFPHFVYFTDTLPLLLYVTKRMDLFW